MTTVGLASMFANQSHAAGNAATLITVQPATATATATAATTAATTAAAATPASVATAAAASATTPASAAATPTTAAASTAQTTATTAATATSTPASSSGTIADGTYVGAASNNRFGTVQVQAVYSGGQLVDVQILSYPNSERKSVSINQYALPVLINDSLSVQSAKVDTVSGATYTSKSYRSSLQSAIDAAKATAV